MSWTVRSWSGIAVWAHRVTSCQGSHVIAATESRGQSRRVIAWPSHCSHVKARHVSARQRSQVSSSHVASRLPLSCHRSLVMSRPGVSRPAPASQSSLVTSCHVQDRHRSLVKSRRAKFCHRRSRFRKADMPCPVPSSQAPSRIVSHSQAIAAKASRGQPSRVTSRRVGSSRRSHVKARRVWPSRVIVAHVTAGTAHQGKAPVIPTNSHLTFQSRSVQLRPGNTACSWTVSFDFSLVPSGWYLSWPCVLHGPAIFPGRPLGHLLTTFLRGVLR